MPPGSGRRTSGRRWKDPGGVGAYVLFEEEAGFAMTPPRARTRTRSGDMRLGSSFMRPYAMGTSHFGGKSWATRNGGSN